MSKIKIFGLGGLNENGKNMYAVDVDNNIFIFDAGLKYPTSNMLGVDYIIPSFEKVTDVNNSFFLSSMIFVPFKIKSFPS